MKKAKFKIIISYRSWIQFFFIIFLSFPLNVWGQIGGESIVEKLIDMGFENVRWIDCEDERIYTIENSAYRLPSRGIKEAISIIQEGGLPKNKTCKLIITHLDIPQLSLTYTPSASSERKKRK